MNTRLVAIATLAILYNGRAFAGELERALGILDRLTGQWVLTGKIAGRQTTHDISAEWTLNHGYLRIHEVSREKKTTGEAAYEAIVFIAYNAKEGWKQQGEGMKQMRIISNRFAPI